MDRRILDTGMTKKQILETDFKPEMAINDVWDVIVIGSGTVSILKWLFIHNKLGCVVRMVVGSILSHTECGPNDHRKDAPRLILLNNKKVVLAWLQQT